MGLRQQLATISFWGPLSRFGLSLALVTALLDQASKLWLIYGFDIEARMPVRLTPFLDLVLVWNRGISYGLLQQQGAAGQAALLVFKAVAIALLCAWLARTGSRLTAASLGLITGGAVGNAIDPLIHQGVADFVLFHITTDTAIVAGVAGLLYESLLVGRDHAAKAP
jgi:signal peptidase II